MIDFVEGLRKIKEDGVYLTKHVEVVCNVLDGFYEL